MSNHPNILQLDIAGQPRKWIDYQQAVVYYAKDLVAWDLGQDGYTIYGGHNRITKTRSSIAVNSIIAIKGDGNMKHCNRAPTLTNKTLFRRDHNVCAYCGGSFLQEKLTRDHIVPRSRGGNDIWMNVVTACDSCNRRKDDHLLTEVNMELLYLPYVPSKNEVLILSNRNILADQMEFLKNGLPQNSRILVPDFREKILKEKRKRFSL